MMSEREIFRHLEALRFQTITQSPFGEITLSFEPEDLHAWTSPDFVVWVTVEFQLAGQKVTARLPIPIEAEKAGWSAAMEDLQKMIDRRQLLVETPFFVIGDGGYYVHGLQRDLPSNITVRQIPDRDIRGLGKSVVP